MKLEFDEAKRQLTLAERGLDFRDAADVLSGLCFTRIDDRQNYGEQRFITVGRLDDSVVVIVWTFRGKAVRVISMRPARRDERDFYEQLGRS